MKLTTIKAVLLAGVSLLALTSCNNQDKTSKNGAAAVVSENSAAPTDIRIAAVNMDRVNDEFQMVADVQKELSDTEKRLTADVQRQATNFQNEYENYLKIGATLTLAEQKRREANLEQKQQDIAALQQTYANQLVTLQTQRMEDVTNTILSYIERYNEEKGPYTLVVMTGRSSGVLYAQPSLDVTQEVIDGLNQEYQNSKKSK